MTAEGDERFMRRALGLAERARGLTSPNPLVGAVVVDGEAVVGEGFHEGAGGPHAESVALAAAGGRARGATLYVTLEPCAHHGRTPPCASAVVASGVRRVVVATGDPDPRVNGRGFEMLRSAGIDVAVGLLGDEAVRQNRVFLTATRYGRPHVTLKAAMTLDGRIADVHGVSQWISGEAARREAHRLRSEVDAIIVGVETALHDDPALTVRLERAWPREPYRVVLDTLARTPPAARLISAGMPSRAVVVVGERAPAQRTRALEAAGATVLKVGESNTRVDAGQALAELFARDVRGVLVEGGAEVHAAFLEAGLVDRVAMFVAPRLLGGRAAPGVIGGVGRPLKDAVRLRHLAVRSLGDDLLIEADVARGE
ncbi:MAG: bifunctional diaminohydroxyphosphoribosylaminopyrimidine deaminase/5-amino-6-(5-phosphoribosylamino)uracil reductase RibD [Candidatus Rokuibacteriota bacterium]|nr:MAG: bifunctional diaminohydroxyphosphoribosylaminopyrimidine deaminase/5-amino-6-(5-phosphoribosylamino)uracil reductase RibD [Candidatus Rokubacteria bacterium]